ncbi:MAG: GNAT family N-acetyltransferase [Acidimicrobiia bacterium]|nr:GNAT family N-acetyltransferase [Acidimicrobiia bacterium]
MAVTPTATHVGPFGRPGFLDVLHGHWPRGTVESLEGPDGGASVELVDGIAMGIGHRDLVDYRSPRGPQGVEMLVRLIGGRPLRIDSLPVSIAERLADELRSDGREVTVEEQDVAAVLALPGSFDAWLASIGKKERHETRRKRRRYEEVVGPARIARFDTAPERLDEFVALHRTSAGEKGSFMTDAMAAYFGAVMALDGWGIDALLTPDGDMAAAGFSFHGDDGYYLYNSAFDRSFSEASPGVVLIASLIEFAIEEGQMLFDFLKGDEPYKFRLGAEPRALFELVSP